MVLFKDTKARHSCLTYQQLLKKAHDPSSVHTLSDVSGGRDEFYDNSLLDKVVVLYPKVEKIAQVVSCWCLKKRYMTESHC